MARFLLLFSFFFTGFATVSKTSFAGTNKVNGTAYHLSENVKGQVSVPDALPESPEHSGAAGKAVPGHHSSSNVPKWDELAHIHHFHRHRMKKMKKHYRKCVISSKLLLLLCHAAILLVSYLHVVSH